MLKFVLGLVSTPLKLQAGMVASANKRLIFPGAKKLASAVSTQFGILSPEEAKEQELIFDGYTKGIIDVFDQLEDEMISILTGDLSPLFDLFGNKDEEQKKEQEQVMSSLQPETKKPK